MDKTLGKFGVVQFDPMDDKFDPNIHEAVYMMPSEDKEPNMVGSVM